MKQDSEYDNIDWNNLLPGNNRNSRPDSPKSNNNKGGNGKRTFWQWLIDFPHDHPVLLNIILIIIAAYVAVWLIMACLGKWAKHGVEVRVPDVKELPMDVAAATLERGGFSYEIIDSVFEAKGRPGSIVTQDPTAGSAVKPGRTVYLTVVSSSPKTVAVPDYHNVSLRQAQATFEGLGIKEIKVEYLPSEYKDLVLGARINGRELRKGERIPLTSTVVLEVGAGLPDVIEETDSTEEIVEIEQSHTDMLL